MDSDGRYLCGIDSKMAFGDTMSHIAQEDPLLSVVVSDYGRRLNLEAMRETLPQAFVQCGIAEQSQVEVASALANEGFHVFAPSYATFITARVLDQVRVLLGIMASPVVLVGLAAGCEASLLGASHMALEDIANIRTIPGVAVVCPSDNVELAAVLKSLAAHPQPAYVRTSQYEGTACVHPEGMEWQLGKAETLREAPQAQVALLATGALTAHALQAADLLEDAGIPTRVLEFATVKPLDTDALDALAGMRLVATVEDHSRCGGFGSAVAEYLSEQKGSPCILRLGMPDRYLDADFPKNLLEQAGLMPEGIAASVRAALV